MHLSAADLRSIHSGLNKSEQQTAAQDPDFQRYIQYGQQVMTLIDPIIYTDQERGRDQIELTHAQADLEKARNARSSDTSSTNTFRLDPLGLILGAAGVAVIGLLAWKVVKA